MNYAAKQIDLLGLIEPTTKLRKVSAHQYAGPCPKCGGRDRFTVDITRGWFCRQCTGEPGNGGEFAHWNDQIDFMRWLHGMDYKSAVIRLLGRQDCTPDDLERLASERKAADDKRMAEDKANQQAALTELRDGQDWITYQGNLSVYDSAQDEWRKRGLSRFWQSFYGVGYCEERFGSDTLTIPYWRMNAQSGEWEIIGLRHRLLQDVGGGKYRPHLAGLGNHLYYAYPTAHLFGTVLVVEGEIKAMVTHAALWKGEDPEPVDPQWFVVGVPGKSWKPEWINELNQADRVVICLDPDAQKEAQRLAQSLSVAAKVINLPGKIDDLIVAGALDTDTLVNLVE